jgi:hypothetical protein
VKISVKREWDDTDGGNRSAGIRNCRFATLYTTKLTWTGWRSLNCTHVKPHSYVPEKTIFKHDKDQTVGVIYGKSRNLF